jgi:XTP/dITP diphosphohydrolase
MLEQSSDLLIASNNQGKVREITALLAPYSINIISTANFDLVEPEETGSSFAQNAQIKSTYYTKHTGLTSLSDDSGLVIPDLGGDPGIYSARWAGEKKDFNMAIQRIYDELTAKSLKPTGTYAYFICALALTTPDENTLIFEGKIEGALSFPARGSHGFGYDPIFIAKDQNKTFAEISLLEKQTSNHRSKAFRKFVSHCFP